MPAPNEKPAVKAEDLSADKPSVAESVAENKSNADALRAQSKLLLEKADQLDKKIDEPLVKAVVAEGRTVMINSNGLVHKRAGPGSIVELPLSEVAHLRATGFLAGGVPEADFADSVLTRGPTVNGEDGSLIRPTSR